MCSWYQLSRELAAVEGANPLFFLAYPFCFLCGDLICFGEIV